MTVLTVTASKVGYMDSDGLLEKISAPAGEAIDAGEVVRFSTTTGELVLADDGDAAGSKGPMVAVRSANVANLTITAIRKGLIDLGPGALSGLTYDQDVYLSDTTGKMSDTTGTTGTTIGEVVPAHGVTGVDKLLRVDL
jgi:hypothetical protein